MTGGDVQARRRAHRRAHRRARRRGAFAERIAAALLQLKGYRIVARGYTVREGEIDLIVRRGRVLAFVEVKYRPALDAAAAAVTAAKRRRVDRAAHAFLTGRPATAQMDLRFDVVLVQPWRWPVHLADAWRSG